VSPLKNKIPSKNIRKKPTNATITLIMEKYPVPIIRETQVFNTLLVIAKQPITKQGKQIIDGV
jgi:hypothetical protein